MAIYDVFISCKSEDYRYAEEIYEYLKGLGINVFLASRELRRLGESEYRRAISKALREAYHLIVFASNPEYIESTWVEYEWDMFVNAKLKGKKQGNILTILKDVSTYDIPMDLWKYESFTFETYRENLIKYVETPESKERKKELQRKEEEERNRRKEEEAKARKREELKSKLEVTAEGYKKSVAALQVDVDKINGFLKELEISHRECPICHNSVSIDEKVCSICGWSISPLEGLPELSYLTGDSDNFKITYASVYNSYLQLQNEAECSVELKESNLKLENELKQNKNRIQELEMEVRRSQDEGKKMACEIEKRLKSIIADMNHKHMELTRALDESNREARSYKSELHSKDNEVRSLQKELSERQSKIEVLTKQLKMNDYTVWVTFCPVNVREVIADYNPSLISWARDKNKKQDMPVLISSFSSLDEAQTLKTKLENKGVTVEIRKGATIVVPGDNRLIHPPVINDQPRTSHISDNRKYGIRISNCGNNMDKVSQIMSRYFNRPFSSFKSALQSMPYYSPITLSKVKAEEVISSLQKLGVYCGLVYTT